jgi:tetratricopeptide (TPR) repeat protein
MGACNSAPALGSREFSILRSLKRPKSESVSGSALEGQRLEAFKLLAWQSDAKALDRAVLTLEDLAAQWPRKAPLHSDLAAAYFTRAMALDRSFDLILALSSTVMALELQPDLPEALFNQFLASSQLGLRQLAVESARRYLRLDAGSGWAEEIQAGLGAITAPDLREQWNLEKERLEMAAL